MAHERSNDELAETLGATPRSASGAAGCLPRQPSPSERRSLLTGTLIAVTLAVAACGHGKDTTNTAGSTGKYKLGGRVEGLSAGTVQLANHANYVLVASTQSTFSFPAGLATGTTYAVTVSGQPAGMQCSVLSGTGTMPAGDVASVRVTCGPSGWAWIAGANGVNANGVYGTQGSATTATVPGARQGASSWTDASGNLWLFGGGAGSAATTRNDLWMYSPSQNRWTWTGGAAGMAAPGVYGTRGVPAAANVPGARANAATWTDADGTFWLFGGYGYASTGLVGYLNDLWKFDPALKQWTWVGGADVLNPVPAGVYGARGQPAAENTPGGRQFAVTWYDAYGTLWLFGGTGYDAAGTPTNFNDLWQFTPATGQWTWMSGSNAGNTPGVYGASGVAATTSFPGARGGAVSWIDASGNLWLFGGYAPSSSGAATLFNDLWRYTPSTGQWAWMAGTSQTNTAGSYGTMGTASAANIPGARQHAVAWVDNVGSLWLFGGQGYDAVRALGQLNDLWKYDPTRRQWTWVAGAKAIDGTGTYGTLGAGNVANVPGARSGATAWSDGAGAFWLFGGVGRGSLLSGQGQLNDLWQSGYPFY